MYRGQEAERGEKLWFVGKLLEACSMFIFHRLDSDGNDRDRQLK